MTYQRRSSNNNGKKISPCTFGEKDAVGERKSSRASVLIRVCSKLRLVVPLWLLFALALMVLALGFPHAFRWSQKVSLTHFVKRRATKSVTGTKGSCGASSNNSTKGKRVALCAVMKDEDRYIDEWIDYYLGLGFDEIHLYDNSPHFVRQAWAQHQSCAVTTHFWPGILAQPAAYVDCHHRLVQANKKKNKKKKSIRKRRKKDKSASTSTKGTHWVGFLDVDEFLVLRNYTNIHPFLQDYLPEGSLAINWYIFGNAGKQEYVPGPVTRRFQMRHPEVAALTKSIAVLEDLDPYDANTGKAVRHVNAHYWHVKQGKTRKDTNGKILEDVPQNPNGPTDVAVVHHYMEKSLEEYKAKIERGRADKIAKRNAPDVVPQPGTVRDDAAWDQLKRMVPKYAEEYE